SMEPCSTRRSRSGSCTELILAAGIRRVVFAVREPPTFADCRGAELLQEAGVEVVELTDLADPVRQINAHLFESERSRHVRPRRGYRAIPGHVPRPAGPAATDGTVLPTVHRPRGARLRHRGPRGQPGARLAPAGGTGDRGRAAAGLRTRPAPALRSR